MSSEMTKYSNRITYQDGAYPNRDERRVSRILVDKMDEDVLFLAPSRQKGAKTPDIRMQGLSWEIKTPRGKSSRTIENNFRNALKQSRNIIFDLYRIGIRAEKAIAQINKQSRNNRSTERVFVITKNGEIQVIDMKRKF